MFTKATCILGAWAPLAVHSAGLYESQQSGGHHRLHRNVLSHTGKIGLPPIGVLDLPPGLHGKSSCAFSLKTFGDVQIKGQCPQRWDPTSSASCSQRRGEARWSPGHWVWWWVCPPSPPSGLLVCWISPRTVCGGSCCCLLFPHPLPENWVEAV